MGIKENINYSIQVKEIHSNSEELKIIYELGKYKEFERNQENLR